RIRHAGSSEPTPRGRRPRPPPNLPNNMTSQITIALLVALMVATAFGAETTTQPTQPAQPPNDIDLSVVPPERFTGEPYVLAGTRIVFTSWYYVRPGGYAWKDDNDQAVSA